MMISKSKSGRVLLTVVVLAALVVGGFLVFKKDSPTPNNQTGQSQLSPILTQPAYIDNNADFKYQKPDGWALLAKDALDAREAVSGIGHPPALTALFTIKVSSSTPLSNDDLKSSTLNELQKNSNFALIGSENSTVDGKAGQKFSYTFGSADKKTKQELRVIPNKGKTYFLLFSAGDSDYDKQAGDFKTILDSFKFK